MAEILKYYGTNLKLSGLCHSVPLEWFCPSPPTYSSKLLRVVNTENFDRRLKLKSYVASVTVVLLLFQGLQASFTTSFKELVLPWMLILLSTACLFYLYVFRKKALEISELINGFIQFDTIYPKTATKLVSMPIRMCFGWVAAKLMFFTQVVYPIAIVFGLHFNDPWKPSLAGFRLIPKLDSQLENYTFAELVAGGIRITVLLYNYWIWNFLFAPIIILGGLIMNLCIIILLDNIEM